VRDNISLATHVNESHISPQKEPRILSKRAIYSSFKKSHLPLRDDGSRAAHVNESQISSQIEPRVLSKRAIYSYVVSKRVIGP